MMNGQPIIKICSLDAPDDERPSNNGIINYSTQLHLVGHFIRIVIFIFERNL
jgi:hypothetical protein